MGAQVIITENETVEPRVLTVDEKKQLTDIFIEVSSLKEFLQETVRRICHYDRTSLIASYNKKVAINKSMIALLQGTIVVTPQSSEIIDGKEVITEAVYNTIPSTLVDLKEAMAEIYTTCSVEALEYNIDKMILWADGKGECTFDILKEYLNPVEDE